MTQLPVLVTGVGGPLGISVLKALMLSGLQVRLVGTDLEAAAVGYCFVSSAYLAPHAARDTERYVARILDVVRRERVQAVFPCSEAELLVLGEHRARFADAGCVVVASSRPTLETVLDKHRMATGLRSAGIAAPGSALPGTPELEDLVSRHGFPLILKRRTGSGSQNLFTVRSRHELDLLGGWVADPVVQQKLEPADEEYTVGVFIAPHGRGGGTIAFRRTLAAGLTYRAEVVVDPEIDRVSRAAVSHFGVEGPANVQLIRTADGPSVFEINPRCSSSTVMRAHFGFNEPEMALRAMVLGEPVTPTPATTGTALRMWEEVYVDTSDVARLAERTSGPPIPYKMAVDLTKGAIHG